MRLLIFIWLAFSGLLNAKALEIHENFISEMSGPYQSTYEDPSHSYHAEAIYRNSEVKPYPKLVSSHTKTIFWSRFELRNPSDQAVTVVLRNLRAGTDYIDAHIYRNGMLTQTVLLGDMRPQTNRMMLSFKSSFFISLDPGETITVVSRFQNCGSYDLQWEVLSTKHYSYINGIELTVMGAFGGLLIAMILYNLMMFFTLKKPVFLAYIIHVSMLFWFQYAYTGMFYFMNIGIPLLTITLSTWFVVYFMLAALGIFTLLFFEFHTSHRKIANVIYGTVVINMIVAAIFFSSYWNLDILLYSSYFTLLSIITLLIYFFIGIYAVYHRYAGAWYYLIGEGAYISSLIYLSLVLSGKSPTGYTTYVVPFAILIEIFAFSLALSSWVSKLRDERNQAEQMIMDEARFTSIGKIVGMAVHQWKHPLSQLGSYILYLRAKDHIEKELPKEFSDHINTMSAIVDHMKNTVNDIYDTCTDLKSVHSFALNDSINLAIRFLKDKLTLHNVDIQIQYGNNTTLYGSKNALTNVFMTLIDNSIAQFKSTGTISPEIKLSVHAHDQSILLCYEDNAGGISITPITNIFNVTESTKGSMGSGIGLSLAKLMVEKRLNGRINVSNTATGSRFEILLPRPPEEIVTNT